MKADPPVSEPMNHAFDPLIAHRIASLAIHAYDYDRFEPWAKTHGYRFARSFHEGSVQAKLLEDGERRYLVFAGTDLFNLREWAIYDFDLRRRPLLGGWVHGGFHKALHARSRGSVAGLFDQITQALAERFASTGQRETFVGGHSLGAALAKLFAAQVAHEAEAGRALPILPADLVVYTTGEPRSGNAIYAAAVERHYAGRMHRGVFGRDWVPQMPLRKLGYVHSGEPHFIERDGTLLPATERIYYRTSSGDHLPQRYMRAYKNTLRKAQGEIPLPIGRDVKQTLRDVYEVGFHPGRKG